MAKSALIIGGTGQIGRAVARRLVEKAWSVVVGSRRSALPDDLVETGVRLVHFDRADPEALKRAVEAGVDVIVDVVPFTTDDARQVNALAGLVGSVVAVSTAGVYTDEAGRSLDTQADAFPQFPSPIRERQPTVTASDETYHTRKVAMEHTLMAGPLPATIVRPCAVQGPGARAPRELFFVKRVLDGRRYVPLAYRGKSRFHTTSVENLAELVWLAAERPGKRVLNCGDPDPPSVLEIARTIASALDHQWLEVLLPGAPAGSTGDTPWSAPKPFVVDMLEAELELRYRPVVTYERSVARLCRWLVDSLESRDWSEAFPAAADHMRSSFDYAAEDDFLRGAVRESVDPSG
jgi:nucleoside-diphosphate-sugar epimerase